MLRLKHIVKNYRMADTEVHALKGIDLSFRRNEFVSILGPSGCGKTTLLNIIGGLDQYTSGDLFIGGRSTKEFSDRDWDNYRNHRVGFIFQSYNLIPHQTVLGNVELALSIAGVSRAERTRRSKQALDRVGLAGQYDKKPNQLSGGQCQRVAVARALVNDPDILLADEPTGALDTETSVQIMDLIREIAREKLVIMVTHNPELAERYSSRIIRLLDGAVVADSNPFSEQDEMAESERAERPAAVRKERAKMSFATAFRLSLKNLFSKKARTILTSIAGAIGIIGISVVLSISYGVQTYIKSMQDDMLSGNPITISKSAIDLSSLMGSTTHKDRVEALKEYGYVNVDSMIEYLIARAGDADNIMLENTITQEYVDYVLSIPDEYVATTFLDYGLDIANNLYTSFRTDGDAAARQFSILAIRNLYTAILEKTDFAKYSAMISTLDETFKQSPTDEDYILSQYDKVYGDLAAGKNEVMIVLDKRSELTDLLLAQLGYYTQEQFLNIVYRGTDDPLYDPALDQTRFSYEELVGKRFVWYPNNTVFTRNDNPYTSQAQPFYYHDNAEDFEDGIELTITGILEPKETISYGCLRSGFYYTEALTKEIIRQNLNSVVSAYLRDNDMEAFSSMHYENGGMSMDVGITYQFTFEYLGESYQKTGFVGAPNQLSAMMGVMGGDGTEVYTLSLQQLGGINLAEQISVYPVNFELKDKVLEYLDRWNSEEDVTVNGVVLPASERDEITYTDNLSIIIALVNDMIDIVTYSLVGFTALSLLVSCVMIGIITHVSVVDRTKEIGVIRSLGGRKMDVANLFNAETFLIGLCSGLIGIAVTYLISFAANLVVSSLSGIAAIAVFPWHYALIMVGVSIVLTLISGFLPARSAAKKDPVNALRSE